ncbi:MAG: formylglycine-generating enzyme family protein, partial [Planctomyces sp.]
MSLTLVRIPGGQFVQGSPLGESGREAAERTRQVTITSDFLLGTTEVTVGQFRRFVEATGYRT